MADGNQDDKTKFAHLFEEFQKQWTFEGVHIADSALYTADNLKRMEQLKWVTRVPLTLAQAKQVLVEVSEDEWVDSCLKGYSIAERTSNYGGVEQRWLIVKSLARQQSAQKQLEKKILKSQQQSLKQLQKLSAQEFKSFALFLSSLPGLLSIVLSSPSSLKSFNNHFNTAMCR